MQTQTADNTSALAAVIGTFDGVHTGHVALIKTLLGEAKARGLKPVAITFDPPPSLYFNPHFHFILSTPREKKELLLSSGVSEVIFLDFGEVVNMEPEEFIESHLFDREVRFVTVGEGFHFGRKRRGDVGTLKATEGLQVMALPKERMDAEAVSATRIRELLLLGHIRRANTLLGYEYKIAGEPSRGLGRAGALLDTPTINMQAHDPNKLVPPNGIYAVRFGRDKHPGVCYIGASPTFGDSAHKIEVHLIDALPAKDEKPVVCFVERLRPDTKFACLDDLKTQVRKDVEQARRVLLQS